ncbi:hypothetical protein CEXT_305631 [Caerostris extrusa]|uniref:Uncharacterized protein n=1 Tax=Caerostris extrusa TaxID=172846 RepID=A0AAV4Y741_CAEEX|nr:hypothetical protein CEXT_305631 [Caerostris extrusa]
MSSKISKCFYEKTAHFKSSPLKETTNFNYAHLDVVCRLRSFRGILLKAKFSKETVVAVRIPCWVSKLRQANSKRCRIKSFQRWVGICSTEGLSTKLEDEDANPLQMLCVLDETSSKTGLHRNFPRIEYDKSVFQKNRNWARGRRTFNLWAQRRKMTLLDSYGISQSYGAKLLLIISVVDTVTDLGTVKEEIR